MALQAVRPKNRTRGTGPEGQKTRRKTFPLPANPTTPRTPIPENTTQLSIILPKCPLDIVFHPGRNSSRQSRRKQDPILGAQHLQQARKRTNRLAGIAPHLVAIFVICPIILDLRIGYMLVEDAGRDGSLAGERAVELRESLAPVVRGSFQVAASRTCTEQMLSACALSWTPAEPANLFLRNSHVPITGGVLRVPP